MSQVEIDTRLERRDIKNWSVKPLGLVHPRSVKYPYFDQDWHRIHYSDGNDSFIAFFPTKPLQFMLNVAFFDINKGAMMQPTVNAPHPVVEVFQKSLGDYGYDKKISLCTIAKDIQELVEDNKQQMLPEFDFNGENFPPVETFVRAIKKFKKLRFFGYVRNSLKQVVHFNPKVIAGSKDPLVAYEENRRIHDVLYDSNFAFGTIPVPDVIQNYKLFGVNEARRIMESLLISALELYLIKCEHFDTKLKPATYQEQVKVFEILDHTKNHGFADSLTDLDLKVILQMVRLGLADHIAGSLWIQHKVCPSYKRDEAIRMRIRVSSPWWER